MATLWTCLSSYCTPRFLQTAAHQPAYLQKLVSEISKSAQPRTLSLLLLSSKPPSRPLSARRMPRTPSISGHWIQRIWICTLLWPGREVWMGRRHWSRSTAHFREFVDVPTTAGMWWWVGIGSERAPCFLSLIRFDDLRLYSIMN